MAISRYLHFCFIFIFLGLMVFGQDATNKKVVDKTKKEAKFVYPNGQTREKYYYYVVWAHGSTHDVKDGSYISYRENGKVSQKRNYVDGKDNGRSVMYPLEGWGREEALWNMGKRTWQAFYYKNGTKGMEHFFNHPVSHDLHGPFSQWYENGRIEIKGQYTLGNRTGIWEKYHYNGTLAAHSFFKDIGDPYASPNHGIRTNWYETGQIRSIWIACAGQEFSNGVWETRWKEWDENGKITYQLPPQAIPNIPCWDEVKDELETVDAYKFTLHFKAEGYESTKSSVYCITHEPSKVIVEGTIVDQEGVPVAGAVITVSGHKGQSKTDASGFYKIAVKSTGSKPFSAALPVKMKRILRGGNIKIECEKIIPVPGEFTLKITATEKSGVLIRGARVLLTIDGSSPIRFLRQAGSSVPITDKNGLVIMKLICRKPEGLDYTYLKDLPLEATLGIRVETSGSRRMLAEKSITVPFNMARIHGTTVGPDMKPRSGDHAPMLGRLAPFEAGGFSRNMAETLLMDRDDSKGEFWLLVHPYYPKTMTPVKKDLWKLDWTGLARLPLAYQLKDAPQPGRQLELGKIDLLKPEEHEERLKGIVREMIQQMPLKPSARKTALKGLNNVHWTYNSTQEVPVFKDNLMGYGGIIATPQSASQYWGRNPVRTDDAAYVIMLHELGHFVHHTLVERHFYLNCIYNKMATGDHKTWVSVTKDLVKGVHLSFAESQADFFAILSHNFWSERHSEIKDSIYFKDNQYLPDFESDQHAMRALDRGERGYMVEGIQTRFLVAYYQNRISTQPISVYSDYLKTMLEYGPVSGELSLMQRPARTIRSWIYSKYQSHGERSIYGLANKYHLFFGAPEPTIMPVNPGTNHWVRIAGSTIQFNTFPVERVPFNTEIEVIQGDMNIDVSGEKNRRTLFLTKGTRITLENRDRVVVHQGRIGADYPVTIVTPTSEIQPKGTVVMVEVMADGSTAIQTLEGMVEVRSANDQLQSLSMGKTMTVSAAGIHSKEQDFDLNSALAMFSQAESMPFDEEAMKQQLGSKAFWGLREELSEMSGPWLVIAGIFTVAMVGLLVLLFLLFLWYLRRFLIAIPTGMFLIVASAYLATAMSSSEEATTMDLNGTLNLVLHPLTEWLDHQNWIPLAACFLGCFIAGALVKGGKRGMAAGFTVVAGLWLIAFQKIFFSTIWGKAELTKVLSGMSETEVMNAAVLLGLATIFAGFGGLLFRQRRQKPNKGPRKIQQDYDNDNYDDSDGGDDD